MNIKYDRRRLIVSRSDVGPGRAGAGSVSQSVWAAARLAGRELGPGCRHDDVTVAEHADGAAMSDARDSVPST